MRCSIGVILATAMASFAFQSCQKQREKAPEASVVPSADGVPIAYDVHGSGKPALVFVHGWCCNKTYWDAQVSSFASMYTVVTIDLAGHGESGHGRKRYTVEAFGEDVAAVVNKLNLERVVLVGHSMGGAVILEAARRLPKRVIGLIGVDTYQNLEESNTPERVEEFLKPMREDFHKAAVDFVRGYLFRPTTDSALVEKVVLDISSASPEVGVSALHELLLYDAKPALEEVRVPIRSINTDGYPTDVEAGRRLAASFDVTVIPGLSHYVMMEAPEDFNRILEQDVKTLGGTDGGD